MAEIRVFISSVQAEFADERQRLCDYIRQDALLGRFFIPFIFEELPAINTSAQEAYLTEAGQCDIYLGLYGERYGYEDEEGISPTEREYDVATRQHKHRLIYLKNVPARHPKEERFIHKVEQDVVRKAFDATFHRTATLNDIDPAKVELFVNMAHDRRNFPIPFSAGIPKILTHLNLMAEDGKLTNSALLLFAKDPQKFFLTSEVKCAQFYGTKVEKPIPFYQVFRGSIFELVDQAVGFVMGHIDARVGDRSKSTSVNVDYEFPVKAVTEAIVNAVAHRDYTSNASVQVMLFRDRLEILNPGTLPYGMTIPQLSQLHSSVPTNPVLAHPIYLAGYIERMGTGTTDIIEQCEAMGLPTPTFKQDSFFQVTLYRKPQGESATSKSLKSNEAEVLNAKQRLIIVYCRLPRTARQILEHVGLSYQSKNIKKYITELTDLGYLKIVDSSVNGKQVTLYVKA